MKQNQSEARKATLSQEELADAAFLREIAETNSYTSGRPGSAQFSPDGSRIFFLRAAAKSPALSLYSFHLETKEEALLLTPELLLQGAEERLSAEERARRERQRISARGFSSFQLSPSGAYLMVSLNGNIYLYSTDSGRVRELISKQGDDAPFDPRFSPDEEMVSFVRGNELWITHLNSGETQQLTYGGTEEKTHAQAEFVAQEEMDRSEGYWWSPDASMLLYEEADASGVERLYLGDPTHPYEVAPLVTYPRAGKKNVAVSLGLISVKGGETTWLKWDQERYPYLTRVLWSADAPLSLLVSSRDQRTFALLTATRNGETQELLVERDEAWLNLSFDYGWLPDGSGLLWPTEREGAWQLALYSREGIFQRYLTPLALGFRGVRLLCPERDLLIVAAGAEPLQQDLYAISLQRGEVKALTHGDGFYDGTFTESGAYLLTNQTLAGASSMRVYNDNGELCGALTSVAQEPPSWPNVTLSRVGEAPGFYTALIKPRSFDPTKRYPVIVRVYGGPGTRTVSTTAASYIIDQWIADHDFIVVKIDGRGTPDRGRAWERDLAGKFSSVPLEDQVKALQALARQEPAIDLSRVGIIGHSFGGYMAALSVLRRPEIYKAAIASAPVTDWLDYDTFYTERYLGVPKEDTSLYEENGLLRYTAELSRPLLIIHGTADDNVHFSQALKLSDALFRAGRDYELVALAGQTHMLRDITDRYWQRVFSFFRKNL